MTEKGRQGGLFYSQGFCSGDGEPDDSKVPLLYSFVVAK